MSPPWSVPLIVALVVLAVAGPAGAQEEGVPVACAGQTISKIEIVPVPPYAGSEEGPWWKTPVRLANDIHVTTLPSVIHRFLIVHQGEPCVERERTESERILRAQPFIAQAEITARADGKGGVILHVQTRDELTPVLGAHASSDSPYLSGVKLGDGNLLGSGMYAAAEWREGRLRDEYAARVTDYQFLGRPYMLNLFGERGDAGTSSWSIEASHRFLTDLQRIAWRMNAGHRNDRFGFLRGPLEPANVNIDRQFFDVGGVVRVGLPGRLSLFGISFSGERDEAGLPAVPDSGVDYSALLPRFGRRKNARINAIWGVRNVYYRPVHRFDALSAEQDMQAGFQLSMLLGRSLPVLGSEDDDILVAADMYAGFGTDRAFAVLEARGEGRQNYDDDEWDGIIGSAHLTTYQRVQQNHTLVASVDWGGGWKSRVPLQLRLGDPDVGVRGYTRSRDAGARRLVARLEDRWFLGNVRQQADVGLAVFADAGRLWAGDAPFGVNTPIKLGAGISLLAAVPAGSKRTWRVDLAFPISPDGRARWEVRLSSLDVTRIFRRESRDIRRSREIAVPSNVYEWP